MFCVLNKTIEKKYREVFALLAEIGKVSFR